MPNRSGIKRNQQPRIPLIARSHTLAFTVVASLFFSWALASSLNDVLIRQFQKALDLTRGQSGLIQSAFYAGYFVAALPAGWVMRRFGYKSGILLGLALYAAGALLFWPAAEIRVFAAFLAALFIIACGLACLETAANPYIAVLGDPQTGPARLNLAQSFHGLGSMLGPLLGGLFIFSGVEYSTAEMARLSPDALSAYRLSEARAVQVPYAIVALFVACLAVAVARVKLPEIDLETDGLPASVEQNGVIAVLKNRQLRAAVVAQFFYVGAQVTIWSYFIDFGKQVIPELSERWLAFALSASFAALLIGRLCGSLVLQYIPAARLLSLFAVINIVLCVIASFADGTLALSALWMTSLFMSIMFPTIFALGISQLGSAAKTGSALLIMSIIGGAILPPLAGIISDRSASLQPAMLLPGACFVIVLLFGVRSARSAAQVRSPRQA